MNDCNIFAIQTVKNEWCVRAVFRARRPIIDGERAATIKRKEVLQKAPVD